LSAGVVALSGVTSGLNAMLSYKQQLGEAIQIFESIKALKGPLNKKRGGSFYLLDLVAGHDLGLADRLIHCDGLLLRLEPDETRAPPSVARLCLEAVDEAVGNLYLLALEGREVKGGKLGRGAGADGEAVVLEEALEPRATLTEDSDGVGDSVEGGDRCGNLANDARRREGRRVRVGAEESGDERSLRGHLGWASCFGFLLWVGY